MGRGIRVPLFNNNPEGAGSSHAGSGAGLGHGRYNRGSNAHGQGPGHAPPTPNTPNSLDGSRHNDNDNNQWGEDDPSLSPNNDHNGGGHLPNIDYQVH